jgi:hypothetical protein
MEREISIYHMFSQKTDTAKLIINKDGLSVENKNPRYILDDAIISGFLTECIDIDSWKHSWHMNIMNARYKGSDERKAVAKILDEKISSREAEIEMLRDAKNILRNWRI